MVMSKREEKITKLKNNINRGQNLSISTKTFLAFAVVKRHNTKYANQMSQMGRKDARFEREKARRKINLWRWNHSIEVWYFPLKASTKIKVNFRILHFILWFQTNVIKIFDFNSLQFSVRF